MVKVRWVEIREDSKRKIQVLKDKQELAKRRAGQACQAVGAA